MQFSSPVVLLNEREAAARLSLSVKTLQQWRVHRRGPAYVKLGRAVKYRETDIAAFIESGLCVTATQSSTADSN